MHYVFMGKKKKKNLQKFRTLLNNNMGAEVQNSCVLGIGLMRVQIDKY